MSRRGGAETAYSFFDVSEPYVPPQRAELGAADLDSKHSSSGSGLPALSVKTLDDTIAALKNAYPGISEKSEDETAVRRAPMWMKDVGAQLTRGRSLTALLNSAPKQRQNGAKDDSSDEDAPAAEDKHAEEEPESIDDVPINSSTLISNTWKLENKQGKAFPVFYFNTVFSLAKYQKMIFDDKLFCRARVNLSFEPSTMLQPQVILELEDKQWVIGTCGTFSPEQQKQLEEAQRNFNSVGLIIVDVKSGEQLDVTSVAGNVVLDFTGRMARAQHLDAQNQSMQAYEVWSQIERSHQDGTPFPSGFYHFYALCVRALNLNSFGKFVKAIETEREPNHLAFTFNSLGIMCKRVGRLDIGLTLVKSAIFHRPAYFEALITLGMWLLKENRELALNLIARAIKVRPQEAGKLANMSTNLGFATTADFLLDMKKRGKQVKLSEAPSQLAMPTEQEMDAAVAFVAGQAS